jgi:uncharacterized protein (TIGR02147 family)
MKSLFEYEDYKEFTRDWIQSQEKSHGLYRAISLHLGIHTTLTSRIFKGDQNLSLEQAVEMTDFLGLALLEREYFICLVEYARAGSYSLQQYKKSQLESLKLASLDTKKILKKKTDSLTNSEIGIFYSHWHYSAIRLITSIESFQTKTAIKEYFGINEKRFNDVMDFLLQTGLVILKNNKYQIGATHTHLSKNSPMVLRVHTNWRQKAIENFDKLQDSEMAYTCPMTVTKEDILNIRHILSEQISKIQSIASDSKSEELMCLNIDWFRV